MVARSIPGEAEVRQTFSLRTADCGIEAEGALDHIAACVLASNPASDRGRAQAAGGGSSPPPPSPAHAPPGALAAARAKSRAEAEAEARAWGAAVEMVEDEARAEARAWGAAVEMVEDEALAWKLQVCHTTMSTLCALSFTNCSRMLTDHTSPDALCDA